MNIDYYIKYLRQTLKLNHKYQSKMLRYARKAWKIGDKESHQIYLNNFNGLLGDAGHICSVIHNLTGKY